ncbi:MAG: fasciclin domain-containing protein [Pseudomonadota bacterium]
MSGSQHTGASSASPNIVEIAAGSDDFNILVNALSTAGLVETVQNADDITVFAPTDAAFTQLAIDLGFDGDQTDEDAVFGFIAGALSDLAPDGDPVPLLTDILLYHVSPRAKSAADVDAAGEVETLLDGATFGSDGTELVDNEPDVANPNIVAPDIAASNGTVQVIDRVLIPIDIPGNTPPNIVEIAAGSDDFNILVNALSTAGLVEAVQNADDITVFAPTDAAFTQLATDLGFDGDQTDEAAVFGFIAGALSDLAPDGDPVPLLTDILLYHVSPGAKSAADVDAAGEVQTLLDGATFGSDGTELVDNEPDVANPNIVAPDIAASNGTVQVIDRVLIPLDIPGNTPPSSTIGDDDGNVIRTGPENDIVEGLGGDDDIRLSQGDDTALGGEGNDFIKGGRGADRLFGQDGDDDLSGNRGDDRVGGGLGNDDLGGGNGDDLVRGGRGRDELSGGDGDDTLNGGRGRDDIDGDDGDDLLNGGRGRDTLEGGEGADTFVFGRGRDVITDFSEDDVIELTASLGVSTFDDVIGLARSAGGGEDTLIEFSGDTALRLENVDVSSLSQDDFIFG